MNVIPFFFNNCSNVYLGGFEIDGNFDQTIVDPRGIEPDYGSDPPLNDRVGDILFVQNQYGRNWGGGGGGGGFEKGQPDICHYPGELGGL